MNHQSQQIYAWHALDLSTLESNLEGSKYHDLRAVIQEVVAAETEYRKRRYTIIDVTPMTIEQTAATVLKSLQLSPSTS